MADELNTTHAMATAAGFITPLVAGLVGWNKLKEMITSGCAKPSDLESLEDAMEKRIREAVEDLSEYVKIVDGKQQVTAKDVAETKGELKSK